MLESFTYHSFTNRLEHIVKVEDYLPYNYIHDREHTFSVTRDEFLRCLYTDASFFPYLQKQINKGLEQISKT
jgi:hypothetical protein